MSEKAQGRPIITLSTDFGLRDDYVGTVKGVILSNCRNAVIVDLAHEIEAQNIVMAAMSIGHSFRFFPPGTVHMVVVDPGVGSDRRILALRASGHLFIAPDNGVLTPLLEHDRFQDAYAISNVGLFAETISKSFHGRDIMAPVAAKLACGLDITQVGPQMERQECCRINLPKALVEKGKIVGEIIHIDHFGNLRTSIRERDIALFAKQKVKITVGNHTIDGICTTYSDAETGKIVALYDSRNHLEIALNGGSASLTLGSRIEDKVVIKPGKE
jgi:S-adenosyl-L-methionine hydrolase (adenosine-forming)